jgi:hypothetical protein
MAAKTKKKAREAPELVKGFSESWLMEELLTKPGKIDPKMSAMYQYSPGNDFALSLQCAELGLQGPCASYGKWQAVQRQVPRHTKALWVLHPCPWTKKEQQADGSVKEITVVSFKWKPTTFAYSQTEGEEIEFPTVEWDIGQACQELEIEPIEFSMADGNCHGYATRKRQYAVSPIATYPLSVTFHEMAHIVLGHTEESIFIDHGDRTPRDVREFEAEAVAYLALMHLDIHDSEEASRGYCQHWYRGNEVTDKIARRINSAAHRIIRAGRVSEKHGILGETTEEESCPQENTSHSTQRNITVSTI